jgi:hypothetical protein
MPEIDILGRLGEMNAIFQKDKRRRKRKPYN